MQPNNYTKVNFIVTFVRRSQRQHHASATTYASAIMCWRRLAADHRQSAKPTQWIMIINCVDVTPEPLLQGPPRASEQTTSGCRTVIKLVARKNNSTKRVHRSRRIPCEKSGPCCCWMAPKLTRSPAAIREPNWRPADWMQRRSASIRGWRVTSGISIFSRSRASSAPRLRTGVQRSLDGHGHASVGLMLQPQRGSVDDLLTKNYRLSAARSRHRRTPSTLERRKLARGIASNERWRTATSRRPVVCRSTRRNLSCRTLNLKAGVSVADTHLYLQITCEFRFT